MTDEQIIKALENCPSESCGKHVLFFGNQYKHADECRLNVMKNALDIIKRQKAEINVLTVERDNYKEWYFSAVEEIEKLKECPKCVYEYDGEMTDYCVQGPCPHYKTVDKIKAEAIKEFEKRLKESKKQYEGTLAGYTFTRGELDNLIKEMTENNDETETD